MGLGRHREGDCLIAIGTPTALFSTPGSSTTNNTTCTLTTNASAPSGSLIVAIATGRVASALTATFSDGTLTWNTFDANNAAATGGASIGYALAPSGLASGATITVTWSASATRKGLTAYYVTGLDTSTPHDTTSGVDKANSGATGNASATSTANTAQNDEIIFFFAKHNAATGSVTGSPSTGYTELDDFIVGASTFLQQYASYKIASAQETPSPSVTYTDTTTNWQAGVIAFKMAAASNVTVNAVIATATADGIVPAPRLALAPAASTATAASLVPGVTVIVAPTVVSAAAAGIVPVVAAALAPTVATSTAAGIVPVIQMGLFLNPPAATATAAGVTPVLAEALAPTVASATASALTPVLAEALAPTIATATAAALVPALRAALSPLVASATAAGITPALRTQLAPLVAQATAQAVTPVLSVALLPVVASAVASATSPALGVALAPTIATAVADAVAPVVSFTGAVALLTVHLDTHPSAVSTTVHAGLIRVIPAPGEQTLVVTPDGVHLVADPGDTLYVQPAASQVAVLGYSNQTSPTDIPTLEAAIGRGFHGLRQNQQYNNTSISFAITDYDAGRTFSYRSIQFNTAPGGWAAAATGTFDSSLVALCNAITAANRWTTQNPFWLTLHHEATTSGGVFGTTGFLAADYKAMWAHCVPVMLATGAPIAFAYVGWDRMFVGQNGVGPPTAGQSFDDLDPGTSLYSRIGSDPYNQVDSPGVLRYGTNAATLLDPIRNAALARDMDWMMGEMGCSDGSTSQDHLNKAAWLDSLRTYVNTLGAYGPGVCRAVLTTQETGSLYNWDSSAEALAAGARFGGDTYFS